MKCEHYGKPYKGEKAVIALTSWSARIDTVGLTIYNLLKTCPGFHIVLTLSVSEFPQKENSLPAALRAMACHELFEILWVKKNYKSMKKILFAMITYSNVPIISADDDCIYTCNYAEILYNSWKKHTHAISTFNTAVHYGITFQHGPCTIYPPGIFNKYIRLIEKPEIIYINHDDVFYGIIAFFNRIPIVKISNILPYKFHTNTQALSTHRKVKCHQAIRLMLQLVRGGVK